MKIAILTHLLRTNYGGVLQNYALQTALFRMGYEVETINYTLKLPLVGKLRSVIKSLLGTFDILKIPSASDKAKMAVHFQEFIDDYVSLTRKIPLNKLKQIGDEFDAVIVGSDQVWRPRYVGDIEEFFLKSFENMNLKKVAYAASFGVSDWEYTEQQTEKCSALAKKFDFISVREKSGVHLCSKYLGVSATHVLDPTMLLDAKDYVTLVKESLLMTGVEYVYILDRTSVKDEIVRAVARLMELNPFVVMPPKYETVSKNDIDKCVYPSISTWLLGFASAEFVVTDSFHGTVFSILFNKPFLVLSNSTRGNERMYSLLSDFGLLDRIIDSGVLPDDNLLEKIVCTSIDWDFVNQLLLEKRMLSYNFLKTSLEN